MTNKDIEDKIRACFKRTHMQTEGDMELFDTDLTVEELVKLFSQLENEARKDELNRLDTNYWGDDDTDVYLNEVLTPYIDDRIATLNKENTK